MRIRTIVVAGLILVLALDARAQIFNYTVTMDGAQETPPVATAATGSGTAVIDTTANTLTLSYSFSGLSSAQTDAHIHGFAGIGAGPAGVLNPLPLGSPVVNHIWNFTEPQEASILAGLTYVNIHSSNFGGGEIRGQIVPEPASMGFLAALAGAGLLRRRH